MKTGKKILIIILALATLAGTVLLESSVAATQMEVMKAEIEITPSEGGVQIVRESKSYTLKEVSELQPGDIIETPSGETAEIRFSGNGTVRIGSESKVDFIAGDTVNDSFIFKLEKGRMWMNTIYTSASVNLMAGAALLIPRKGAFDTLFDGTKTVVRANVNQVGVGLVLPDFNLTSAIRFNASAFINSYLVAQGSQTTIFLDTVVSNAETLKKLLYSKLIKEFQYTLYDKADFINDVWLAQNVNKDRDLAQAVSADKMQMINSRGLKVAALDSIAYQLQKAMNGFADVFTFSEGKVNERLLGSMFDQIYDAEYLLVFGRSTEAKQRLDIFQQIIGDEVKKHDDDFKKTVMSKLRDAYAELVYVLPDDPLFEAKTTISDIIFGQLGESDDDITEKFDLVRDYMNYAYRLADSNPLLARTMLQQYFSRLTELITVEKIKLSAMKNLVAEENQTVDNLLRQYPAFYQTQIFDEKYKLENEWLAFIPEGDAKIEEKQTIINTKIDFLKTLQIFFFDEKVTLADAYQIVRNLIVQIKDLQTGAEVAVSQLIELRLTENTQFLNFIRSAQLGSLRGTTMREKYDSFLALQKEQVSLQEILQQYTGAKPVTTVVVTADQILNQIKDDFAAAKITDLQLGSLTGIEQKTVEVISANINGVTFSGQYDWDKKLISGVTVEGKTITQASVRLENLGVLLKPKPVEQPATQQTQVTQVETVSKVERVAKILLMQKLKGNGISLAETDVSITDLSGGIFSIKKATLVDNKDVNLYFSFSNKDNIASFVVVSTQTGDVELEGNILVTDLAARVLAAYQSNTQQVTQTVGP